MSKSSYQRILEDKPIAYHPDLARIAGSVTAGIFLSQLVYWSPRGIRKDGYIWKTQKDWEEETALSRYEQETARKKLKTSGILLEKLIGIPAKLHYKIDWKILNALLDAHYAQASMRDSRIQGWDNPANSDGEIQQSITESTPESTPESTQENTTTTSDGDFSEVVSVYENNIAVISAAVESEISAALEEFPKQYLIDAIEISATANHRSWRYINGILKKWRENGRQDIPNNRTSAEIFGANGSLQI